MLRLRFHSFLVLAVSCCAHAAGDPPHRGYADRKPDAMWTYKQVGGKDLQLSVFLPATYAEGRRFPAFVVFHGGSWTAGEASWHYPDCAYWSDRGMIAVSVDYRLRRVPGEAQQRRPGDWHGPSQMTVRHVAICS